MSIKSIVRPAIPEDYASLWDLARLNHNETNLFSMSEAKVDWIVQRLLRPDLIAPDDTGPRGYIGVIGNPGGPLEAFIVLIIGSYWYTDEVHLEEFAMFVHPNHRRSKHANALLEYSKKLSDAVGLPLLLGVVSNKRTEAKVRLCRRHLPEAGAFFLYFPQKDKN